jgi:magnesium transporter
VIAHACAVDVGSTNGALRVLSEKDVREDSFRLDQHALVWIDLAKPDQTDVDWLRATFDFHPIALEDVMRRHQRPKIDGYTDYYFVVLYAALQRTGRIGQGRGARIETRELQFFWSKTSLVTIHSEPLAEIDDLLKRVQEGSLGPILSSNHRKLEIADVAYRLIDSIIDGYFPVVDRVAEWTENVEEEMFSAQRGSHTLHSIFALKKDLFHFRKIVAPTREVINSLLRRDHDLFGDEFVPYFQDVYDHVNRVIDSLDTYRDLLTSGLDTYLSFVSNDVNQTVKRMTALTAILMVDALIAGIYGMNFSHMPELGWQFGYPLAIAMMLLASLGLFAVFRRLRWF